MRVACKYNYRIFFETAICFSVRIWHLTVVRLFVGRLTLQNGKNTLPPLPTSPERDTPLPTHFKHYHLIAKWQERTCTHTHTHTTLARTLSLSPSLSLSLPHSLPRYLPSFFSGNNTLTHSHTHNIVFPPRFSCVPSFLEIRIPRIFLCVTHYNASVCCALSQ